MPDKVKASDIYDLCVVGAGMIGAAAARHASMAEGVRVCLIGPSEPQSRGPEDHGIYGAHYDEERITRATDSDPVWATLAQESIKRYRQIERESGIMFYKEVGNLMVGTRDNEFIRSVEDVVTKQSLPVRHLDKVDLEKSFPYLKFGPNDKGIYEPANAGHISPRKLVYAQKLLAQKNGCRIIDDVVSHVTRTVQSDGRMLMKLQTEGGAVVLSRKVLMATGAFTNFRTLLPGVRLDELLCPLTVALVELTEKDAKPLREMPTLIYSGDGHPNWHPNFPRFPDGKVSFYMLPPIKYPDGKYYVKLGHWHGVISTRLQTAEEVKQWFLEGNKTLAKDTAMFIGSIFKDLKHGNWRGDSCVVVETPTNRPYIDTVHAQLGVATGGNGYAAKSSDEIGRLGAAMMLKGWDSTIPQDVFKLRLLDGRVPPVTTSRL